MMSKSQINIVMGTCGVVSVANGNIDNVPTNGERQTHKYNIYIYSIIKCNTMILKHHM